jgi:methylated-DNA-[protein]-cysteine S-methyltransferase
MDYQAKLKTPFGVLGILCTDEALTGIEFLAPGTRPQSPRNVFAQTVCEQLLAYIADPDFRFDLPLQHGGTAHQNKVWQAMCAIPRGQVRTYGDLAAQIGSAPRAVGQACGNNPIPVIIPCHRVVGKSGMGGFMHRSGGDALDIKRWLLKHEGVK